MPDREWFAEGVQVFETGEEEYFAEGAQLNEDQADEGGGATATAAALHGIEHGHIYGGENIAGAGLHLIEEGITA